MRWRVATGEGATRRSTPTYARSCLVHAPCTHLGPVHRRHAESANDWILCDCDGQDSVGGGFGTLSVRAVRKTRCDSVLSTASSRSRIARSRLCGRLCGRCDFSVLGELVMLELDRPGCTSDRARQGDVCGDGCGSVGKIIRATEGATKTFGIGPSVAATGLHTCHLPRCSMLSSCGSCLPPGPINSTGRQ